jgi:flagellar biosynthesis protein FliR
VFETLGCVLFLSLDGPHVFLAALHSTFVRWPVGGLPVALPIPNLVAGASATQELGVLLAAPLVLCLFLTTVVLAFVARAAPQMNLHSVGFALRLGAGLLAAVLLLPDMIGVMVGILGHVSQLILGLLDSFV